MKLYKIQYDIIDINYIFSGVLTKSKYIIANNKSSAWKKFKKSKLKNAFISSINQVKLKNLF